MMASRVTLDTQARLVHRENGKLILPFEHFANAVMLKHINRPHTMHLNLEATVRAVSNINLVSFPIIYTLCFVYILGQRCYSYLLIGDGVLHYWA